MIDALPSRSVATTKFLVDSVCCIVYEAYIGSRVDSNFLLKIVYKKKSLTREHDITDCNLRRYYGF